MNGMIWHEVDPKKPLSVRIADGVAYYAKKYGTVPDVVFVNIDEMRELAGDKPPAGVECRPNRYVLRRNLVVGELRNNESE